LKKTEEKIQKEKTKVKKVKNPIEESVKMKLEKKKKLRKHAGNIWEDASLEEWPDNDYRLFVGVIIRMIIHLNS